MAPADPAERAEIAALLMKAELFSGLLVDDLDYAASRSGLLRYRAGERVFSRNEPARRFYVVRSGSVSLFRADESGGQAREMARYVPGDVFGDFEFAVQAPREAAAVADGDLELVAFPGEGLDLEELARERPDATARILLRSLSMISSRLRSTQRLISENAPWVRELRRQIYTDPGTGLWSRAFLDEELGSPAEKPTAIVLVKPDRFKELNDRWGHAAGDEAMGRLAEALQAEARELGRGWPLRLRSNETALVVPGAGREDAAAVARRLARSVGAMGEGMAAAGGESFSFTASIALATWPDDGASWKRLVEDAYGLLSRAWKDGGDRVYRLKPRVPAPPPPGLGERRGRKPPKDAVPGPGALR